MKFSRFVTNPDSTPLHSSELAGTGAPTPQSFTERKQLERQRQAIGSYQRSLVGGSYGGRGQVRPGERSAAASSPSVNSVPTTPQSQGFREPPTRGYNPYS